MGNAVADCYRKQDINKAELSMVKEEKATADIYRKKTTSDDTLKYLIANRLRKSQTPKNYNKGKVKVTVL